jgi:hypothetical protein
MYGRDGRYACNLERLAGIMTKSSHFPWHTWLAWFGNWKLEESSTRRRGNAGLACDGGISGVETIEITIEVKGKYGPTVSLYQRMHACSPNIRKTHPPSLLHKTRLPSIAGFRSLHDHDWGKPQHRHGEEDASRGKASCNRNRAEHAGEPSSIRRRIPPASKRRTFAHGIIGLAGFLMWFLLPPGFPMRNFLGVIIY